MGIFANDTVTVFNYFLDKITEEEIWIPHLLKNVNLVVQKGANISTTGLLDADSAKLYVDYEELGKYLEPVKWKAQTLEQKREILTFQPQSDLFVRGDLTEIEPMTDGFKDWLLSHYDDVFVVTNVDKYEDVMPHLEIGGK